MTNYMRRHRLLVLLTIGSFLAAGCVYLATRSSNATAVSARTRLQECLEITPGATGAKLAFRERECGRREAVINSETPAERASQRQRDREAYYAHTPSRRPQKMQAGVFDVGQGPPGASQVFHTVNEWDGQIDGHWYVVYAGTALDPDTAQATQAALRVYRLPPGLGAKENEHLTLVGSYVPPNAGTKALKIVSADGSTLTVEGAGGPVSFDVTAYVAAH
jgi:hypothetical protein